MSQQSFHQQEANGSNITFTITTFTEDEIKVYVDGVESTNGGTSQNDYTIPNYTTSGGTITWYTSNTPDIDPPASPSIVRVVRQTDVMNNGNTDVEGKATFTAGSSIKAGDLNNNQKQVLRSLQEHNEHKIQKYDIEDKAVTREKIALDAVDGTRLADNAVNSEHITADSLDTVHYAPGSIDATAIGTNAVTSGKILNDNVTMEKLGSGPLPTDITVNSDNIVDGSIQTGDIGTNQITTALIANDQIDSQHYVDGSIDTQHIGNKQVTGGKIADGTITSTQIADGTLNHLYYTETELNNGQLDNLYYTKTQLSPSVSVGQNVLDARYFTEDEVDNNFLRQDSSELIASGVTWSSVDDKVATTKAIDLRIIDLVDDVGGFVPIADELSFPNDNPDINDPDSGSTIVSIKAMSTSRTPSSGTVTIANGTLGNSTVTITGCGSTVLPAGFGVLVETTSVGNTYQFHRLVPKATEVSTVAANAVNIAAAGANIQDIHNFADLYQISTSAPTARADSSSLVVGDLWFDSSSNKVLMIYDGSSGDGFTAATPNASDLANIAIVAGQITFTEDLGNITDALATATGNTTLNTVAGIATEATTVAGIASDVTAVAGNATNINAVAADAADIGAVAGKATEIGRLGTADAVADMNTLGTSAIVTDMDTLADISSNITTVANNDSNVTTVAGIASNVTTVAGNNAAVSTVANNDANITTVAGSITNVNTTAGSISNVNTVAGSISNVNTAASNVTNINNFANRYRIASSAPTTNNDEGDLYFDTTSDELRVYNGTAWQGGVTATGNLAGTGANTFTGDQTVNANIVVSGTVDGKDISALGITGTTLSNGVTATTQSASDNSTKVATTAYTDTAIANLVDSSPSALNTLNELAAALGDDANFSTTVTNSIATKLATNGDGSNVTNLNADNIASGTLAADRLPNHSASLLTSGTIPAARVPTLNQNTTGSSGSCTGTAENANTLDNIDSSSFVRSDASDTLSGTYDFTSSSQYPVTISGSDDGKILLKGSSNPYIRFRESNTDKALFQWSSSGYLRLRNQEDGSELRIQDDIKFSTDQFSSTSYKVWHEGNDGAGSGLDADTLDGISSASFLRSDANDTTSGELTISNSSDQKLVLAGTNNPYILFQEGTTSKAYIQWNNGGWLQLTNSEDQSGIRIKDDIIFTTDNFSTTSYKMWHEGNDGPSSGLNADTVDGIEGSSLLRSDTADSASGDITFNGGAGAVTVGGGSDITFTSGTWTGNHYAKIQHHSDILYISGGSSSSYSISLRNAGNDRIYMRSNGTFYPQSNGSQDLGQSSNRWNGIYTQKVYFSGSTNYLSYPSGEYGSIQINGSGINTYEGFSIDGRAVFMHDGASSTGIYNDVNNQWLFQGTHGGSSYMYHNGTYRVQTTSAGASINGALTASGNITAFSDARLKTNVNTIDNALDIVDELRGVSFDWKESGEHSIGVIAQEIEEVLPELVLDTTITDPETKEETTVKTVDYGKMVGVLINAVKELRAEVEELKGGK